MNKNKNIASPKEIRVELESSNMPLLFAQLVDYATFKMSGNNRQEAEDLVSKLFEGVVEGTRSWPKSLPFRKFLFGTAKSMVYNYNRKKEAQEFKNVDLDDYLPDASVMTNDSQLDGELRKEILGQFKNRIPPPDELEELILECWLDDITKPKKIREELEELIGNNLSIGDIYNAIKRIERKLPSLREDLKKTYNV